MAGRSLTRTETTLDDVPENPQPASTAATGGKTDPTAPIYSERLWVPLWWWAAGLAVAGLLAAEIHMGNPGLLAWLPYVLLLPFPVWVLLWLSRLRIEVADGAGRTANCASAGRTCRWT